MEDIDSVPDLLFEDEPRSTLAAVHENWLMKRLHKWEMDSERRIKWETMGKPVGEIISDATIKIVATALAGEAAHTGTAELGDVTSSAIMLYLAKDVLEGISNKFSQR